MNSPDLSTAEARRASRRRALLRDRAEAVRGTEMDYTQGGLGRAILPLSVPMMLDRSRGWSAPAPTACASCRTATSPTPGVW